MANTPKPIRKDMKKGATETRAARNGDMGFPKTTAQTKAQKNMRKEGLKRIESGNIGAGRPPKQVAADKANVKGSVKESKNPSMKMKAAIDKNYAAYKAKNK